jgi:hypothetical protein
MIQKTLVFVVVSASPVLPDFIANPLNVTAPAEAPFVNFKIVEPPLEQARVNAPFPVTVWNGQAPKSTVSVPLDLVPSERGVTFPPPVMA